MRYSLSSGWRSNSLKFVAQSYFFILRPTLLFKLTLPANSRKEFVGTDRNLGNQGADIVYVGEGGGGTVTFGAVVERAEFAEAEET